MKYFVAFCTWLTDYILGLDEFLAAVSVEQEEPRKEREIKDFFCQDFRINVSISHYL